MTKESNNQTNKKNRIKKPSKPGSFYRYLAGVLLFLTILSFLLLHFINVIPGKYFLLLCIAVGGIEFFLIRFLLVRNKKRAISSIICVLLSLGFLIGIIYEANTLLFLHRLAKEKYKTVVYEVVTLKSNSYKKLEDLKDETIGILNTTSEENNLAVKFLEAKLSYESEKAEDYSVLEEKLLKDEVKAILIEQSSNEIAKEENEEYKNNTEVIYTFEIQVEVQDIAKKVDVTKESFNIYISGIDTYGSINSVSRSDVNIIATVNPNTHEIRLTSIPRDYYVGLHSKDGYKDKLTHAGIYGVEESVETLQDLLNIDINYYVKVNFTSVIDIVDTIGPIVINSKYSFTTGVYDEHTVPYSYAVGKNTLNGKEALAFARERKAFKGGDRVRNENQQIIIEAIMNKVLSPSILVNYNSLLKTLSNAFVTNMTEEEITTFIKKQLDSNADWKVSKYVLQGTDSYEYTYSYKSAKSYVMLPDSASVNEAISGIDEVFHAA